MNDLINYFADFGDFFLFWQTIGIDKFIRFFWFFFLFELPRYIILDAVALVANHFQMYFNRHNFRLARETLYSESPRISIIVPGKNEGEHYQKLVRSLNEQTYRNFEIIIVDDGSDDLTPVICQKMLRDGKISYFFRNDFRGGKASAANLAWRYAEGKFIVHIDADCSFDRDAIEKIILPFFLDKRIGCVGGNIKVRNAADNLCTSLQAIEYLKSVSVGRRTTSMMNILRIVSGAFGAFRRDVLEQFGGWDVGPGLDGDITVKTRKVRSRVYFAHDAICFTTVPRTFRALARQRIRWSRSLIRFRLRKHRDIFYPNENFQFLNLFTILEDILFSLVFDFKWLIYIIDILVNFPVMAKYIIPANFILYFFSNTIQFLFILWVSERRREEVKLFIYIPLMPIYMGLYMRYVRTWAYLQEFFFRSSYNDPWNPWKVSVKARELDR